jgi:hypothetical protein
VTDISIVDYHEIESMTPEQVSTFRENGGQEFLCEPVLDVTGRFTPSLPASYPQPGQRCLT